MIMAKTKEELALESYMASITEKKLSVSDKEILYHASRAGKARPEHSKKMKGQMVGTANPMHGKQAWNKGLDKTDPRVLANVTDTAYKGTPGNQHGKGNVGKLQDEEWKRKRLDKIKGPHALATCPHCGKEGGERIMKRWHFDNCKMKDASNK